MSKWLVVFPEGSADAGHFHSLDTLESRVDAPLADIAVQVQGSSLEQAVKVTFKELEKLAEQELLGPIYKMNCDAELVLAPASEILAMARVIHDRAAERILQSQTQQELLATTIEGLRQAVPLPLKYCVRCRQSKPKSMFKLPQQKRCDECQAVASQGPAKPVVRKPKRRKGGGRRPVLAGAQIGAVREAAARGASFTAISEVFGVSWSTVERVVRQRDAYKTKGV